MNHVLTFCKKIFFELIIIISIIFANLRFKYYQYVRFRNDIQGLRALAFILVFLFHLKPEWFPGGFLGVDVFFVISGYLISTIVINQINGDKFSLGSFYEKRIKRIVPAYLMMLLAVAVAGYFLYLPTDVGALRGTLFRSALFVSNALFASGESYFGAQSHENPLLHTWSLAIEMQFYLFLPLFLLLFTRRKYLLHLVVGLILVFTGYSSWQILVNDAKTPMYFSLLARIPEFLIGTLFSLLSLKNINLTRIRGALAASVGVVGLIVSSFLITSESGFPGFLALVPCISLGLILISSENVITGFFSSRPMVLIGQWSYSLYLWHWPIMAFFRYKMIEIGIPEAIFITVATFGLSYLSYTFIEIKFQKFHNWTFTKALTPVAALAAVLAFFLPSYINAHELDSKYSKATFGLKSNGRPEVEIFGSSSPTVDKKILLIGDSHALMLKPFLNYIGEKNGFSFRTLTSFGIPPIPGIEVDEYSEKDKKFYSVSLRLVSTAEQEIRASDVIFFAVRDYCSVPSISNAIEELSKSLRPTQKLVLLKTFPIYKENPLRISYSVRKTKDYSFTKVDDRCSREFVDRMDSSYSNVVAYDLAKSNIFSTPIYYKDTVAYYDGSHINTYGSIEMAKDLHADFTAFMDSLVKE